MSEGNQHRRFGVLPPDEAAQLSGIEFLRGLLDGTLPAPPFAEVADVSPVAVEPGRIVFEGTPSRRFYNPMGIVHGGWLALLLDTAMGCAVHSTLAAGESYVTIEMKTVFARAVSEDAGRLRCEATLLHRGGRMASAEGRVFDDSGRLVAHGSETCLIQRRA